MGIAGLSTLRGFRVLHQREGPSASHHGPLSNPATLPEECCKAPRCLNCRGARRGGGASRACPLCSYMSLWQGTWRPPLPQPAPPPVLSSSVGLEMGHGSALTGSAPSSPSAAEIPGRVHCPPVLTQTCTHRPSLSTFRTVRCPRGQAKLQWILRFVSARRVIAAVPSIFK